jgi:uncharacterized phage-associated protein
MRRIELKDVANWFIARVNADEEYGENITNLRLQKLVYYAQGFSLAWYGQPLFDDTIEAWAHGPVVPRLYDQYEHYGAQPIPPPPNFEFGDLDERVADLLEEVYRSYGQFSALGLRNLTREEAPWRNTPRSGVITHEAMQEFFAKSLTYAA